ncbi:hypothetical protein PF005_g14384 [Phytophthora fragariae]|uniref:Uncharacterized protein n=1 Tax=Phytophthora fragariae TaxID=53985 RepID=A0A6A3RSP5_9STRA|nr:hypothetical protein PF003_g25227 [Phytophthora fragariae]KAE8934505.1 hypothetical protein PF009_g15515 [Phytophthora fragariae]KAE9001829.1 hypothetical protein PF011_g13576 [Phytophthora fragariae]KAE9101841.1 hypothetical protein PF010_g14314 [Phytophthora fragariae]KAE9102475.1 hypothetical protein PF007_g14751 [Phytophthora fragariae]
MKLTAVARVLDTFPPKVRDRASVIVSDFIIAEMSLARACKLPVGTFELLNLIWTRSHRDKKSSAWTVAKLLQTQVHYYRWQFNQALIQAARRGDLIMVRWVLAHFRHCHITKDGSKKRLDEDNWAFSKCWTRPKSTEESNGVMKT